MSTLKLFQIKDNQIKEIDKNIFEKERTLQNLVEKNMKDMLGLIFLASEYTIDEGRMDSIAIDENFNPIIIEYKKDKNQSVINQGLFYMDWLLDHKDNFYVLALKKLGKESADKIDWSIPKLYCIANDFNRYDENAIKQMSSNICLFEYNCYGDSFISLELVSENIGKVNKYSKNKLKSDNSDFKEEKDKRDKSFEYQYNNASDSIKILYDSIADFILNLSDNITENRLKLYSAFKAINNLACVEIHKNHIFCYLNIKPDSIILEENFSRDVTNIGHWGTGNLEIKIENEADVEKLKDIIINNCSF